VTAVQRFGGNLGLNVHLHALVLDGAFARDREGALQFHELSGLRQSDIARVAARTSSRVTALLARRHDDGTTHLAFEPLVFLERLAALVPPPRSHLVLYHGVLSSHASWRAEILPPPEPVTPTAMPAHCHAGSLGQGGDAAERRHETAQSQRQGGERPAADVEPPREVDDAPDLRARRLRWAQLLQRVFGLDVLKCTRCGGRREVIAFILRPTELNRICAHLGYPTEAPPIAPARAPPQPDLWDQRDTG
jgi:hypothetical protein